MPLSDTVIRIAGLSEVADSADALIVDLWGVMHNGGPAYPEADHALRAARAAGLKTVFLSNAPRTRDYTRKQLDRFGVHRDLHDAIVTSGALARDMLRDHYAGRTVYHMGPGSDSDAVAGLPVRYVDSIDTADVIHATGLDFPTPEAHQGLLEAALKRKLPFLCANPDRVVYEGGRPFYCPGAVADIYSAMGGEVLWFGKPEPLAFEGALHELEKVFGASFRGRLDRVIMIGDSLQTDVAGARAFGLRVLQVVGELNKPIYDPFAGDTHIDRKALFERAQHDLPVNGPAADWGPDWIVDHLRW